MKTARARTLPDADAGFNTRQEMITKAVILNRVAWNIQEQWLMNELMPKKEKWVIAYADYLPTATRTPLITFTKTNARKEYEKPLRLLVKNLESNPQVSDEDRRSMGIVIPSPKQPIPPPTRFPVATVDSSTPRIVKINYRDSEGLSKGKPYGVHGAEIKWGILDTPPVNVKDLTASGFDTRSPFSLEFEEDQRGKTLWFCVRWENTKGEKGPWGEIGSAIIS
jgi:hypothetical protein